MLIRHWPLNGNLNDYSGFNKTLVNGSGTSVSVAGKIGNALNKTSGYYSSDLTDIPNNLTISLWFKHNGTNWLSECLFGTRSGNNGFMLYRNETDPDGYYRIYFWYNTTTSTVAGYNTWPGISGLAADTWYHVTITRDSSGVLKSYINGNLTYTGTPPADFSSWHNNGYQLCFHSQGSGTGYTAGDITFNDIRVYDHTLSEYEVKEVAKAKILHYTFDDPYEEPTINYVDGPLNPDNGWGTRIHTTVPVSISDDNLHGYSVYGYKLDNTTNASSWSGNAYSYTFIRQHSCISGKKYTASAWCYVSPDSNIDWARVSSEGAGNSSMYYDMTKKGTWQRLVNTFTASSTAIASSLLYFSMNGVTTFATMTGYIIFAAPQFEEKDHATPFVDGTRNMGITDISGFKNIGTSSIDNSIKLVNNPRLGSGAAYFDGTTTVVTNKLFQDNTNQEWTVSAWFWLDNNTTSKQKLNNFNVGNYIVLSGSNGKAILYANSGVNDHYTYSSGAMPVQTWTHIAYVYRTSDRTCKIYLNGVLDASTGNYDVTDIPTGFASSTIYGENFKGYLDDIRVYATALSDADIKSLYERRANLDNMGNLQISTLDVNGIGSDNNILSAYKNQVSGTYTGALKYYRDYSAGTDSDRGTISYSAAPPEYNLVIGRYPNPWGVYDRMARVNILTTHYSQYRNYSIYYYINIDTTKTYRFTQWVYTGRVASTSDSQRNYYGIEKSTVCNLNTTTANTNPYFAAPTMNTTQVMNKWALYVYYVYPYGSTGNPSNNQGFYYPDGTFEKYGSNFNWNTGYTTTYVRQYIMYQSAEIAAGSHVMIYRPRIEVVDGTEESLDNLIKGGEHRPIVDDFDNIILNKTFTETGTAIYTDYDEVTGTANPAAQHEITNTGKLSINGEVSEVD